MPLRLVLSVLFIFIFSQIVFPQGKIQDSLSNHSFEQLKKLFFDNMENEHLSKIYAKAHLIKAKNDKNITKIADSYLYLSYISDFNNSIAYSDSIINTTNNFNDYDYPALGYMIKGYFYYNAGKEKKALDLYLEANKYAELNKNIKQQIEINQFIGGLKYNFGNYNEALAIFKEQYRFIKKNDNFKETYFEDYLIVLDDISKTYLRGNQPDSSLIFINEGIKNTYNNNDKEMYYRFLLTSGSNFYFLKQYDRALDSLNKLKPIIKDSTRLAMCLYYRGKTYEKIGEEDKAIIDFRIIDTIYQNTKISFIELRDVYKSLFNFYSKNGTETEQLQSIKKLITIDSILDKEFKYSNNKILKEFDLPKLKKEKQNLENTINDNIEKSKINYIVLISLLLLSLILISRFYIKQKKYKKRYNEIINNKNNKNNKLQQINKTLDSIPNKVVEEIIDKLDNFEKNKNFLNNDLTLNDLSKQLATNSSYLSKIINYHKQQSFSSYINSLRINYVVNDLKHNNTLRNYTINAIAKEIGYNTAESFSKAFYKEKGIYPSYFIKQLNK